MGELRKDYILNRFVIIATERGKRPDQFKSSQSEPTPETDFFARGNENMTPPEIERFPKDVNDWQVRVFPNKFAAVHPEGKAKIETHNNFFTFSDSFGYHEVIVDTPDINTQLWDLDEQELSNVFKILKKRLEVNINSEHINYVTVFKNSGSEAGTSLKHSHCQLVSYNIIPQTIIEKEHAIAKYPSCPYCSIINIEKDSFRRCFENPKFIAFTPYASRFPFEIIVFPKRHILNITEFDDTCYVYLAEIMKKILLKLKELNAPYNFYFQYGIKNMHFHIEIIPRLAKWAGFEHATGTIINTMTPESAAEFYRSTN